MKSYVSNLVVRKKLLIQLSLGFVLMGGSFACFDDSRVVGIALMSGGIYCAALSDQYSSIVNDISEIEEISHNVKVKK